MPHVLLVDDEAALCDSLTYTLQKEGYTVTTAANGHSAIKQFHKQVPDVILLDLMLPEVDGMEVCWRIRAFSNVPHQPILKYLFLHTAKANKLLFKFKTKEKG